MLVDPLTSTQRKQRTPYEELVAEFGKPDANTIRAVLEDACGTEWSGVVVDWMANMGRRSPAAIVHLALRIRSGATISAEALAIIPPLWLQAAHELVRLLSRAEQQRAERALAALPRAERAQQLAASYRRIRSVMSSTAPAAIRADVAARLRRTHIRLTRRVERYARQLPTRNAIRRVHVARRRETSGRRRARAPTRRDPEGEPPHPSSARCGARRVSLPETDAC